MPSVEQHLQDHHSINTAVGELLHSLQEARNFEVHTHSHTHTHTYTHTDTHTHTQRERETIAKLIYNSRSQELQIRKST